MALITCQNAAFSYDGKTAASGLDFSVQAGDYLCVVGENGSGKSTLIKGLLRLINPNTGSVVFGDGLKAAEIGYLPQQTAAQKDFPSSVYEVVLSGRLSKRGIRPFYSRVDKAIASKHMEHLGIWHLANHCYRELSGGQQQRALLARALCATDKLLLLDEPVAGLDPKAAHDFYGLISRINRAEGVAIIMVSHDVRGALKQASHILHLANRQLFYGAAGEYVTSTVGRSYFGGAHRD
jgi:zinc transport system ATP-binding protein